MRKSYLVFLKVLLSGVLVALTLGSMHAQLALTRSYFTGTYTSINGGPGTVTSTATGDDGIQTGVALGFTFNYLGNNYTTVDFNTNGALAFSGSGLTNVARDSEILFTTTAPNGIITAWFDDMSVDGSANILYQLSGSPGSQVFTVEWRNVLAFYTTSTQRLNFQVKLYEGTNVIEFHYGTISGTQYTSESASIGCENNTGGPGNFLDVVTGSSRVGNYFITASTEWPARFYRLTPGAPTPLAGGTYTAGSTGTFPNLTEAVAAVNHHGISGPVVISLTDANYDVTPTNGDNWFPIVFGPIAGSSAVNTVLVQPASGTSTLTYGGSVQTTGGLVVTTLTTASSTTSEPILALVGSDYVGVQNINLTSGGSNAVDRGLLVMNVAATDGATFNGFANIGVTLNRSNTATIGIQQSVVVTPTGTGGANSNNAYLNLNIQNTYNGMYLLGNATYPDLNSQVGTSSPSVFNTIGGTTANDIGNGTSQSYGIRMGSQSGASIFNNNVQNVGSTTTTDGILVEVSQGVTSVFNNNVSFIRGTSTTSTTAITGIRANVATSANHTLRVYNNGVSNILSAYTGAASATRQLKGIYVQSAGGGVTSSTINVDHNSVYLDHSSNPNISSNCYEIGTATGPVINTRNNIFMNATGAQTSPAVHLGWRSTSATVVGNTGSVSNYNDLYIPNATQGFTGQGNTTNYATLANWQAAMVGQDANSVAGDPVFTNTAIANLHATGVPVNNVGTPIAWVTTDIDNQARHVSTPDMGYDEFTPLSVDVGATVLVLPVAGACYTASEPVTIRIRNYAGATLDFSANNVTVNVNVTGAIVANLNVTLNSGTLASAATLDVPVGNLNMSAAGTYTFNATATAVGDGNSGNDAMVAANRTFSAGTAVAAPGTVCEGDSSSLTLSGQNGTSFQWQVSTDNGTTWNSIVGGTTSPFWVIPSDTSLYRALVCGLIPSTQDTVVWVPTAPPVTTNDTLCGTGAANLTATGAGNLQWYDALSGGNLLFTGSTYAPVVSTTTTYYVESSTGTQNGLHTTTYIAGNGSAGNCFTIKALSGITITGFDGHVSSTASGNWEIWYRPNDYLLTPGSHLSQTGWTQLGVANGVPGMGAGNVTPIPIALSLQIPAGQTYSFQIFVSSSNVSYTNGTVLGAFYNGNADLEVYQGHGGTAFSGMVNSPRVFNGRIHYNSGCSSARVPSTVTVTPADSLALSPTSAVSCGGDSVTLSVSSANTGYAYTWTPNGTLSSGTGSTVMAGPTATTTYVVNAVDSVGCQAIDSVRVTYINKPVVTAMVTPDTICPRDSIALTSSVASINFQLGSGTITNSNTSYPSPYGNWFWGSRHQMLVLASELQALNLGAGWINSMAFDVTNTNGTQPLDNYEIKMALTSVNSITAFQAPIFTSVFFQATYMPTVGQVPQVFTTPFYWDGVSNILIETCHNNGSYIANASVNQSTTPFSSTVYFYQDAGGVCTNLSVSGSIAQRPNMYFSMMSTYGYDWQPSAFLATPTAANTVGIATSSTDFILMVMDSATGCVGVDTASVFSYPGPSINLGNDGYYCGTSTLLDAGNPGSTYLWSTLDSSQTILATSSGTYSVDVTDTIGCTLSDTVVITFTPFPTVNLGANQAACQGSTVTLNAGNPGASYLWNTTATTQTIGVTTTGNYSVAVTDTFGCSGSDTVTVTIHPLPTVSFNSTLDTLCTTSGPVTLTGGSPSGGTYSGPGVSAGVFSPATAGAGSHTLSYQFTDANGCSNTATHVVLVEVCPGIADGFNTLNVGLYPNPNDGRFTFTVPVDAAGDVHFEIADARGVVVLRDHSSQPSGVYTQAVSLADFAAGVYTLRVSLNGKTAHKRLVVQR